MFTTTFLAAAAIFATANAAFDPLSKNNVITYWGQGPNQARLVETCKNSAYDIINIGFVNVFPDQGKGGWPGTNFGNACWGDVYQNAKGEDTSLLKTCPTIGEDVIACQQIYGKKIFLSLGGGKPNNYYLDSIQSARNFANFLWAAFGPVSASTSDVPRPWGDAVVDGFDFDIESYISPAPANRPNYQKAFYTDMIKRFKNGLFPTDTSKKYYISGAPQCIIPDVHFTDIVANSWFDFLFIQFYNTEGCSARNGLQVINGRGDQDISYLQWVATKSLNPNVRMSIGLPAAQKASGLPKYYLNPTEAQKLLKKFYKNKLFGGVMLWEATFAVNNKICGTDYGSWIKNILKGQAAGKDIATTCAKKRDLNEYGEEVAEYEEAPASTSSKCTETKTLTRSKSSVPAYGATGSASSPAAPITSSKPVYSMSKTYSNSSSSAPYGLCTKTSTLIYRTGYETSTYIEACASTCTASTSAYASSVPAYTSSDVASSPAASYPAPPEESNPAESYSASPEESSLAASYPASPEQSSPAASYPASEACGEVTVTVKEQSTVYVTATAGASSEDTTSTITTSSTSTIWSTTTVYLSRSSGVPAPSGGAGYGSSAGSTSSSAYPEASAPSEYENSPVGGESSSSIPAYPEASSPAEYENSPVGGEGSSSSAPAVSAYPTHGHHHGQRYSHSHEDGPSSTTTVVNTVTIIPESATSGAAAQPTGAPYPYGPAVGNGTSPAGTASASAPGWSSYPEQQTGGASAIGVSGALMSVVAMLAVLLL